MFNNYKIQIIDVVIVIVLIILIIVITRKKEGARAIPGTNRSSAAGNYNPYTGKKITLDNEIKQLKSQQKSLTVGPIKLSNIFGRKITTF